MNNLQSQHDQKVVELAAHYEQAGFKVLKNPLPSELPFDLNGYRPDILAMKEDSGLIVEVKTKTTPVSIDKLQSVAQEISQHSGWRFLLVTLDDIDARQTPTALSELPTWSQLTIKLQQAAALVASGEFEPAFLYLWSIFEAGLRKQAIAQHIPIEMLPTAQLLKHMYSQGEISVDEIDFLQESMNVRNLLTHGANENIEPCLIYQFLQTTQKLLQEWSKQ